MSLRRVFVLAMTVMPVCAMAAWAAGPSDAAERLGSVHFPTSCTPAAQQEFERAAALLHSFWYEEAVRAFTAVTAIDPNCAIGYWGIAMSHWHPLWAPPTAAEFRSGWAAIEKAKGLSATPREAAYIAAVEAYYKDWETVDHRTRALAYEKAMEQVYQRYPDDREAAIFYALALDATALPTDKTYGKQTKAAAILEKVFAEQPNHPGVAHYLIHSYDYAPLAAKALPAARSYAKIAPSVPHALHMPSHIFTRLGLWEESVESNRASANAGHEYAAKLPGEGVWDQTLHSLDYLVYAHLQRAQDREAKKVVDEVRAMRKAQPETFVAAYAFAAIPARHVVERRRWAEAASLTVSPSSFPWDRYPWALAINAFARGLGAARSGDVAAARQEVATLASLRETLIAAKQAYWADQVEVQRRATAAWLARAERKDEEALTLMRSAADLEDSTEKHPVTPAPIVPARELLADLLLELNQPAAALKEFEASQSREPNRFNGFFGAGRAAELSGDVTKARSYYTKVVTLAPSGDAQRAELQTARAFLGKK
jgi:tetratricopeptide (TPR) repeat protein